MRDAGHAGCTRCGIREARAQSRLHDLVLVFHFALEDALLHGTEHLLVGGLDGAVAEGLEGQDGEGLLDLDADLLIVFAY